MRAQSAMLARTALTAAILGLLCWSAQARSLKIVGTAGYLAGWEPNADVSGEAGVARGEFSGPISLKHVGMCTVNGPVVKDGNIKLTISGWGPLARLSATMTFQQTQCTYSGSYTDPSKGTMDCS